MFRSAKPALCVTPRLSWKKRPHCSPKRNEAALGYFGEDRPVLPSAKRRSISSANRE
jgi:hypothetical protein